MLQLPNGKQLFDFQEDVINFLIQNYLKNDSDSVILKSPTGSGKTVIMTGYIDSFIEAGLSFNTSFIWLTPGSGELEEQSKEKMEDIAPNIETQDIQDAITNGFAPNSVTFINWEKVTNKKNKSVNLSENKNLLDQIEVAHKENRDFILIIDEEHSHNTSKANNIINKFAPIKTIRVSATANKVSNADWYEVKEEEVIMSGLIKKSLYVNKDIEDLLKDKENIDSEHSLLLEIANKKRLEIIDEYKKYNKDIRPLVIIQFPSSSDELINKVENYLEDMGYSYQNNMVAKWMSEDNNKINLENIEDLNAEQGFLLIKQAISTGWDSPRSQILVKLRENMNEVFEIQTLGRIRRMPEAHHYENNVLDYCYLYTFDDKYKQEVLDKVNSSFEVTKLFLKDSIEQINLIKENRDIDYDIVGLEDTYNILYEYFKDKYNLSDDVQKNREHLEIYGFVLQDSVKSNFITGQYKSLKDLNYKTFDKKEINIKTDINNYSLEMMRIISDFKNVLKLNHQNTKVLLINLFSNQTRNKNKILRLNKGEWYAFIINNYVKIKEDFKELLSGTEYQDKFIELNPKRTRFNIPTEEFFKYSSKAKNTRVYEKNTYQNYNRSMTISPLRYTAEQMLEEYCETSAEVEWIYKNGDSGKKYFSIVYLDGLNNQWLFYPDYIIKLKNEKLWIIETKGGEFAGESKNIDRNTELKFKAFKKYAERENINFGFVRYMDQFLYINNEEYTDDMNSSYWKSLEKVLK